MGGRSFSLSLLASPPPYAPFRWLDFPASTAMQIGNLQDSIEKKLGVLRCEQVLCFQGNVISDDDRKTLAEVISAIHPNWEGANGPSI